MDSGFDPQLSAVSAGIKSYARFGAYLDTLFDFDATAFRLSKNEASALDPQHRLLLELAAEALAGLRSLGEARQRMGLFVGSMYHEYATVASKAAGISPHLVTGAGPSFLAGRTSFVHGLGGPCASLDTACSSSLVAVALAGDSLATGAAPATLAAGVNAMLDGTTTAAICQLGALSPVGRCQSLDAAADGYGRGEGFAVVGLASQASLDLALTRRKADMPTVQAVLAGWAVNQAGPRAALSAPTGPAQTQVLRAALQHAALDPGRLRALGLHGTGTLLGDPLEIAAIGGALGPRNGKTIALLSSKATHGHTEGAAGLTGALGALRALHQRAAPAVLHLRQLNPHVRAALQDWRGSSAASVARQTAALAHAGGAGTRLAAGTSSFGMGGVNAHVVLEDWHSNDQVLEQVGVGEGMRGAAVEHLRSCLEQYGAHLSMPQQTLHPFPSSQAPLAWQRQKHSLIPSWHPMLQPAAGFAGQRYSLLWQEPRNALLHQCCLFGTPTATTGVLVGIALEALRLPHELETGAPGLCLVRVAAPSMLLPLEGASGSMTMDLLPSGAVSVDARLSAGKTVTVMEATAGMPVQGPSQRMGQPTASGDRPAKILKTVVSELLMECPEPVCGVQGQLYAGLNWIFKHKALHTSHIELIIRILVLGLISSLLFISNPAGIKYARNARQRPCRLRLSSIPVLVNFGARTGGLDQSQSWACNAHRGRGNHHADRLEELIRHISHSPWLEQGGRRNPSERPCLVSGQPGRQLCDEPHCASAKSAVLSARPGRGALLCGWNLERDTGPATTAKPNSTGPPDRSLPRRQPCQPMDHADGAAAALCSSRGALDRAAQRAQRRRQGGSLPAQWPRRLCWRSGGIDPAVDDCHRRAGARGIGRKGRRQPGR